MAQCLAALEREQAGSSSPVVDHEIVGGAGADPGDATLWLICRNETEQRQFTDSELSRAVSSLRRKLIAAGMAEGAVDALTVRVTSREEVDRRGGPAFFR